ncbi:MAG: nucleolar RNA-binding Nop10p family protein [Nanoarchaeota archaeon]
MSLVCCGDKIEQVLQISSRQACGDKTESLKPPKYSPVDKYANYRREAKRKELQEKGML